MNASTITAAMETGIAAYGRADYEAARTAFEQALALGHEHMNLWLCMSHVYEKTGDEVKLSAVLDHILRTEPRNLYGLVMKGDAFLRRGDDRAAVAYYQMALTSAASVDPLPADIQHRLGSAQAEVDAASARFRMHLEAQFAHRAIDLGAQEPRFREAIRITSGDSPVYLQQPTSFFYPRLPHVPFYDPGEFAWAAALEAAAPLMRGELEAVLSQGEDFAPYVKGDQDRPNRGHSLLDDPRWSAFHLFDKGRPIARNAARCPQTMAALAAAPMPHIAGRSPMAFFSLLRPHTHIPPHNGMLNTRLICHIPLIVPPRCRLRVGGETRAVEAGKAMIFDDSIEHEAWNDSDHVRVVLIFEVWRPELEASERMALTALFESVVSYGDAAA